jgi:hypothetical protein
MTLEEAIMILQKDAVNPELTDPEELEKAEQLGIEALTWLKNHRKLLGYRSIDLLPGETKE